MAQLTKRLLFLALYCTALQLNAQFGPQIEYIVPDPTGTTPGELCFVDTNDSPGALESVCIKAPADVTTPYDLTLPAALPGSTACVTVTDAGVVAFDPTCTGSGGATDGDAGDVQLSDGAGGHISVNSTAKFESSGTSIALQLFNSGSSGGDYWEFTAVEGVQDHFVFNKIGSGGQELRINAGTGDFLTRGDWLPQTGDGTQDIATAAASIGNTFSELVNTKELQVENAGETAHFTFELGASGLDIDNTATTRQLRFTGSVIEPNVSIVPSGDGSLDLGTNTTRFDEMYGDYGNFETVEVSNSGHSATRSLTMDGSGNLLFRSSAPATVMQLSNGGALTLYGSLLANTDSSLDLGQTATRFRVAYLDEVNAPIVRVGNTSHSTFWNIAQGGDVGELEFNDGSRDLLRIDRAASATVNFEFGSGSGSFNPHLLPPSGSGWGVIGADGRPWADAFFGDVQVGYFGAPGVVTWIDLIGGSYGIGANLSGLIVSGGPFQPGTTEALDLGTASLRWNNIYGNFFKVRSAAGTCTILSGSGAPGGACNTCDVALRTDGGAGSTLYVCEGGAWAAM